MKYAEFFKLIEKKDHLINKLTTLSKEQKQEAINFFTKHPNYESEIDWNRKDLDWEDFEIVINKERVSKSQLKNFVKKGTHFLVLYSDNDVVLYQPLTWLGSRYLASKNVAPGVESKWCISYQKSRSYWDSYSINEDKSFIFICTNNTKYAAEISTSRKGFLYNRSGFDIKYWDANDNVVYDEVIREIPNIEDLMEEYAPLAIENHSLVEERHQKDLEETEILKKREEEAQEIKLKVEQKIRKQQLKKFAKDFETQVAEQGYYIWKGNLNIDDLKTLNLIDSEGNVDDRLSRFKVLGNIYFRETNVRAEQLPISYKGIDNHGLYRCRNLTDVTLPSSLTSLGDFAFSECRNLKNINLPTRLEFIGNEAFSYCSSLEEISIPLGVKTISSYAFLHCNSLKKVIIPNNSIELRENIFSFAHSYGTGIKLVIVDGTNPNISHLEILKDSSTWIDDYTDIKSIDIQANIKVLNTDSLKNLHFLEEIKLPNSIEVIEKDAFKPKSKMSEKLEVLKTIYIDKPKGSLDLSNAKVPRYTRVLWKGEF